MKLHTIKHVKPIDGLGRLWIDFDDEDSAVVDLAPILAQGGVFESIRKWQFDDVQVGARGRSIFWQLDDGEIVDLCADELWLMVHPEDRQSVIAVIDPEPNSSPR